MKITIMKVLTITIYILAVIAFSSIVFGFIRNKQLERVRFGEIENVVFKIYDCIDKGNYVDLYYYSYEGRWIEKSSGFGKPKSYSLDGLIDKNIFIEHAIEDYGKNGWRVHFSSLEITDVTTISRADFASEFSHENEILNYFDYENYIKGIYIVNVKGYIIGSCAIANWEKKLPLIWTGQSWKAIVTGTPEDLNPIHREQWLTDIKFRITNFG